MLALWIPVMAFAISYQPFGFYALGTFIFLPPKYADIMLDIRIKQFRPIKRTGPAWATLVHLGRRDGHVLPLIHRWKLVGVFILFGEIGTHTQTVTIWEHSVHKFLFIFCCRSGALWLLILFSGLWLEISHICLIEWSASLYANRHLRLRTFKGKMERSCGGDIILCILERPKMPLNDTLNTCHGDSQHVKIWNKLFKGKELSYCF